MSLVLSGREDLPTPRPLSQKTCLHRSCFPSADFRSGKRSTYTLQRIRAAAAICGSGLFCIVLHIPSVFSLLIMPAVSSATSRRGRKNREPCENHGRYRRCMRPQAAFGASQSLERSEKTQGQASLHAAAAPIRFLRPRPQPEGDSVGGYERDGGKPDPGLPVPAPLPALPAGM